MVRVGGNCLDSNRKDPLPSSGTHWCDMVDHRQVRDDPVKRLNQNRHLVRGEASESLAERFADDVPEQRQHGPGVRGNRKRPRPAIGEARAPLGKSHGFQPIKDADEPRGCDSGQFRKPLLSDSFILGQHEQRSALRKIERQIPGTPLEASHIQPTRFAQTEARMEHSVHLYLNSDLAEMAAGSEIFKRPRNVLHLERLVDHRSDSEVIDHPDHALEHFH